MSDPPPPPPPASPLPESPLLFPELSVPVPSFAPLSVLPLSVPDEFCVPGSAGATGVQVPFTQIDTVTTSVGGGVDGAGGGGGGGGIGETRSTNHTTTLKLGALAPPPPPPEPGFAVLSCMQILKNLWLWLPQYEAACGFVCAGPVELWLPRNVSGVVEERMPTWPEKEITSPT